MTTAHPVVLPSINELFPEHLLRVPHHAPLPLPAPPIAELQHHRASNSSGRARPHAPLHKPYSRPSVRAPTSYSFDVLKSDPYNVSLTHIASSAANASARPQSQAPSDGSGGADELEDADADPDGDDPGAARKHVCATCQKRFNRPSSLRIHMNVHSGATPYRCPHPGCGRAFNVSSNMRRHLRNHAPAPAPTLAITTTSDAEGHGKPRSPPAPSPSTICISPTSPLSADAGPRRSASPCSATDREPPPWTLLGPRAAPAPGPARGYSESDVRSQR